LPNQQPPNAQRLRGGEWEISLREKSEKDVNGELCLGRGRCCCCVGGGWSVELIQLLSELCRGVRQESHVDLREGDGRRKEGKGKGQREEGT
jgi:hypothetical protein